MDLFIKELNAQGISPQLKAGDSVEWVLEMDNKPVAEAGFSSSLSDDYASVFVRDLSSSEPFNVVWGEYDQSEIKALINENPVSLKKMAFEFARQISTMVRVNNEDLGSLNE